MERRALSYFQNCFCVAGAVLDISVAFIYSMYILQPPPPKSDYTVLEDQKLGRHKDRLD